MILVALMGDHWMNLSDFCLSVGHRRPQTAASMPRSAGEELVEIAGRTCYKSYDNPRPGGNRKYIEHILESGHGSVLEHAVFSFIIRGISRSLTHELVRHRVGTAFSQQSQRFVDESECRFVLPPELEKDEELIKIWQEAVDHSRAAYCTLANKLTEKLSDIPDKTARRKKAREAARSVLPECTETAIYVTFNARALRHFIELRGSVAADAEIRRLAIMLYRIVIEVAPNLFQGYEIATDDVAGEYLTSKYCKV